MKYGTGRPTERSGKAILSRPFPSQPLYLCSSQARRQGSDRLAQEAGPYLAMEDVKMLSDKRLWYAVGAVILLILIGFYGGLYGNGGESEVAPTEQQEAPAQTQ